MTENSFDARARLAKNVRQKNRIRAVNIFAVHFSPLQRLGFYLYNHLSHGAFVQRRDSEG